MPIKKIEVSGLRGFCTAQTLDVAIPNGTESSGLTILVGPNSGGKSTVIEAIRAISQNKEPSFTVGKRNQAAGDRVEITISGDDETWLKLKTIDSGGSECAFERSGDPFPQNSVFVLPSRRFFNPLFAKAEQNRQKYIQSSAIPSVRSSPLDIFSYRLFNIQKNREEFDKVLKRVIDPVPDWTIDQSDGGQYFLKCEIGNAHHNSDGLGEGVVSLLFIIDALYDSKPGDVIAIDEPELSLHPTLLRRLSKLFSEFAADRQIIIATHSPYFANLRSLADGARLARVYRKNYESKISVLSSASVQKIMGFFRNVNNPHVLGLDAREVFFLNDKVILTEGQEDVIFYERFASELELQISGDFFGWGVGGATNMSAIAGILSDLGFSRVVGILDGDKADLIRGLETDFPKYSFHVIPEDDVRTKPARQATEKVDGLAGTDGKLQSKHRQGISELYQEIAEYMNQG